MHLNTYMHLECGGFAAATRAAELQQQRAQSCASVQAPRRKHALSGPPARAVMDERCKRLLRSRIAHARRLERAAARASADADLAATAGGGKQGAGGSGLSSEDPTMKI